MRAGDPSSQTSDLKTRVVTEVKKYATVVAYLWVLFAAFDLYKSIILEDNWRDFWGHGFAIVNALIFGKIILIGDALNIGGRSGETRRIYHILRKAFLFAILLIAFHMIETAVKEALHGHTSEFAAINGRDLRLNGAAAALFFLFLIPFLVFEDMSRALGGGLWDMLFVRGERRFKIVQVSSAEPDGSRAA
jgi:hypothetical protein